MRLARLTGRTGLFIALFAALIAGGAPARAQKGAEPNPHATVSSDGVLPAANLDGVRQDKIGSYVPGAEGSGELAKDGKLTISEAPGAIPATADGNPSPQSVIGADGRVRITATTSDPYRRIVSLVYTKGSSSYICTGWLISANTVATAGHCVYSGGVWATNMRVYPGRNGSSMPYGSCGATRLYASSGWTQSGSSNYDYGAIKLNCSVGNQTGWFGYRVAADSGLTGQQTHLAGYPGDKPSGTLWYHADQVRSYTAQRIFYANDTAGGQSGSAVWNSTATCNMCAIAVHTTGGSSTNGGTRITQEVFNNLTTWKNAAP